MKKHLQKLIAFAFISYSVTAVAQPTLTGANMNPIIGETFAVKYSSSSVAPGSAGANQTWNLTGLTASSNVTATAMSVASTPSGAAFPSANIAFFDGTNYAYYNNTAVSFLNQGAVGAGVVFSYSNPETMLPYPFNFNNTNTDTWGCTFTNASMTFTRSGTTTVTADGYGTVTTLGGTFTNAMRVHFVQSYMDVSSTFTLNYSNDQYIWYSPGTHYPVAAVYTLTSLSGTTPGGHYINGTPTGLNSFSPVSSNISLFPNPASGEINVAFNAIASGKADLIIYDITGKQLQTINELAILPGENNLNVNTQDLPAGIYFMGIYVDGAIQKNDRFVITR